MTLSVLGIDAVSEQIYRLLAANPGATAADVASELGLASAVVAKALVAMAAAGLIAHSGADATRLVAAPPAVALGALVLQHRDELRRAEHTLAEVAQVYRVAVGARAAGDLIEVVSGVEAIRHRFDQVQRAAQEEVLAFVTAETLAVSREDNDVEGPAVARGVRYRIVLERDILAEPGALDIALAAIGEGEEIRIAPSVPLKLVVADRATALVPLLNAGEPGAVVVHASGLLDALVALFESVWSRATPLRADGVAETGSQVWAAAADVEPIDNKILALLLAGFTDQAVASQLGISMRTVARRVRHLMDVAGVQTRLQLGHYASRAGWA